MTSEDLEKDLYKNWVRGAKGLEYLQEGLQDFVGDKVHLCRNQSLQNITNGLPTGSPHQCYQCTSENLLPEHAKSKACTRSNCIARFPNNCFGSKQKGRRKCPNGICSKLYDEIVLDHFSRDPLWTNTDPSSWCSDPVGWSFGHCFQTTKSSGTSADTTDATGLLSILINNLTIQNDWLACSDMSSKMTCPFNRARDIRNAILHSPKLELEGPILGYYLDTFVAVLQDAKCLLNCNGSKQAVDKLLQLKNQQINISQEDEKTLLKSRKEALSELDEKTREGLHEIDNRTATALSTLKEDISKRTNSALCDIEKSRLEVKRNVQEEKQAALSELKEARKEAAQDLKESSKDILSDLDGARKEAGQEVKESRKAALHDLEQAKIGAIQDVKESTKAILPDLEKAKKEATDNVKESTDAALSYIKEVKEDTKQDVTERTKEALSNLELASLSAKKEVQEKTKAAQFDLEQARIGARLEIDDRKVTSLSEIEVAKCQAIDQMKQQQTSIMMPGGENSSTSLYSFKTSAPLSEGVDKNTGLHFPLSAAEDAYLRRKTQLKDDLITFYKDRHSTIPLSPLFEEQDTPLVDFYVLPHMKEVKKMFTRVEGNKSSVKSLSDVFKKGSGRSREVYLTADAGVGKTAFSKYLAVTWCQAHRPDDKYTEYFLKDEINAMREYEFVFLVLLRDSSEDCSIDDLIVSQIMQNLSRSSSMTIDSLQEILHSERCLVVLDGLDEWTHAENKKCSKVPKKIPHRNAREKCTVLTTTRPWKFSVINLNSSQVDKKLELVKLTSKSAQTLKERAISKIKDLDIGEAKNLAKSLNENIKKNRLEDLESVPLLLMYLICLWCEDVPLGQSKCGLYTSIIELLLSRTMEKYPEMEPTCEPSQSDIPQCFSEQVQCKKNCTCLTALGQLAVETLTSKEKERKLVFDASLAEKYLTPDQLELSLRSGILTQSKHVTLTTQSSKISFSHKTVQEYFCALYIICQNESDVKKIFLQKLSSIKDVLDMSTVFVFIRGMNATIMSAISGELMPVISGDKITSTYRSMTAYDYMYVDPMKDIQNMYISCFKENPDNNDLKLCCQDFIIDEDCREESHFTNVKQLAIHNKNNMQSILIDNNRIGSLHEIIDSCGLADLSNIRKIYYEGECKEEELVQLLDKSVECVTVISQEVQDDHFISKFSSCSNELCKTFQNKSLLQAFNFDCFQMEHQVLEQFVNFIVNRKSMEEINLYRLSCVSHGSSCPGFNLDFTQHSRLRPLGLLDVPVQQLEVNVTQLEQCDVGKLSKPGIVTSFLRSLSAACKLQTFDCSYLESSEEIEVILETLPKLVTVNDVRLTGINLGERSPLLSPEMINIKIVRFWKVTLSATLLRDVVSMVEKLPHTVTVIIRDCNIRPETEFEHFKQSIQTSQKFLVTYDDITSENMYTFRFETVKN